MKMYMSSAVTGKREEAVASHCLPPLILTLSYLEVTYDKLTNFDNRYIYESSPSPDQEL